MRKYFAILAVILLINATVQLSLPNDPTYIAAVVEFDPTTTVGHSIEERLLDHTKKYVELINTPATNPANNFDIIVFPESTLNVPHLAIKLPKDHALPCTNDDYEPFFRNISCAAKQSGRYVVINLTTKTNCTEEKLTNNDPRECSRDGWNLYNTNVVFNRKGQVIATYRKFNLFEKNVNKTLKSDIGIFETDFGVRFGMFICFDILFQTPSIDLIKQHQITNIVYPTMWFSELPFLTAVQAQQHWAYKLNVNFLAAGASAPSVGSTGSGIYSGHRGAITSIMSSVAQTKLLIAEIPKNLQAINTVSNEIEIEATTDINEAPLYLSHDLVLPIKIKQDQVNDYSMLPIHTAGLFGYTVFSLCQKGLCCNFYAEYKHIGYNSSVTNNTKAYNYVAAVTNSRRSFSMFGYGGIQMCAILACTNPSDYSTCGTQFPIGTAILNNFEFVNINISGTFPVDNINTMPTTVTTLLMPQNPIEYTFYEGPIFNQSEKGHRNYFMSLRNRRSNLLTFGIYARDFAQDNSSAVSKLHIILAIICTLSIIVMRR